MRPWKLGYVAVAKLENDSNMWNAWNKLIAIIVSFSLIWIVGLGHHDTVIWNYTILIPGYALQN